MSDRIDSKPQIWTLAADLGLPNSESPTPQHLAVRSDPCQGDLKEVPLYRAQRTAGGQLQRKWRPSSKKSTPTTTCVRYG